MQTKTINKVDLLTNSNFLNNQNYILSKSENKKVISKYFTEKRFNFILLVFSYINSLFLNPKYYKSYSFIIFIFFYIIILLYSLFFGFFSEIKIFFLLLLPYILYSLFFIIKDYEFKKINNINDFIFIEGVSIFNTFLLTIFMLLCFSFFYTIGNYNIFYNLLYTKLFYASFFSVLTVLLIIFNLAKKTINIFNILFLPLIYFFMLHSSIVSHFYKLIYPIKIFKYLPENNFLKKFDNYGKYYAENDFYRIEV